MLDGVPQESTLAVSAFDLFKIGIGPSSSHTVGPMRAAGRFVRRLALVGAFDRTARVRVELYGSLGATGRGHATDTAILLGLEGDEPDIVDVATIAERVAAIGATHRLRLGGTREISFDPGTDLEFSTRLSHDGREPFHVNNARFVAFDADGTQLDEHTYFSVGGGFVVDEHMAQGGPAARAGVPEADDLPYPFRSAEELVALTEREGCSIAELVRRNERTWRTDAEIDAGLLRIWRAMQECVARGMATDGELPGILKVRRRAKGFHDQLLEREAAGGPRDPLEGMEWVNLWAMAVNEENAAGGRVVTAPTNGAAGIVPAVLHYYARFVPGADDAGVIELLLTATAIGVLFKENASISGAEVGCQGEVGSACSMAAGGLAAVLGGTPAQVENAAEIGIEHNLGLTCDPVGGLVQIPCIERNALAGVKAINAARMALAGDGTHHVSLDAAIRTMRDTGADMHSKYKETSRGGLALNVVEC
jgi:L-serine dehydratase